MSERKTYTLDVPGAVLTYDVHTPATPGDAPPLFVLASPMAAKDFGQLVEHLDDRFVITYDPRGMERSILAPDGEVSVPIHADDFHRVAQAARAVVGDGPVDVFASSGGAVNVLSWIVDHPAELGTVVAHEPPLWGLVEDSAGQRKAAADIAETYQRDGFGPAMAKFIQLVSYPGLVTDEYLARPAPDPAMFGLPTEDDGSRDDLLLRWNMATMPAFDPDLDALRATTVRLLPAHGAAGEGTMARRGGEALAAALGVEPVVFPGDHGGFVANEWSPDNDPAAFAARLREVLAG
ncbi:alpha/beta hydrolase [Isoptericola sp. NEAU-Y5]|uniref:Alpha/beta hydrolase n=1 Tax=Isoptericola luteus TaxID=2879484 RepID=A0ABS7Z9X3_9MICO|nr:alpha/beta hydrolase [Isoptericola sp. NEAU-Y5]MCA5891857.1 alpha/beta hydrolase [Isoptericola sp. NEAU-Y5]